MGELENTIEQAARACWTLLASKGDDQSTLETVKRLMANQSGGSRSMNALAARPQVGDMLAQAMRTAYADQLRQRWGRIFESGVCTTPEKLVSFIKETCLCISRVGFMVLGDGNFSGTNTAVAGAYSDIATTRPAAAHKGWSLHLTASGSGLYECVRQKFASRPGDLVLLSPDAPYEYARAPNAKRWIHKWFFFQPSSRLLELINWPELGPNIFHLHVPADEIRPFDDIFAAAAEIDPQDNRRDEALFHNLVEQALIRAQPYAGEELTVARDSRINDAKAFIVEHIREPFRVEDVASFVKLSRSQLSARFKRSTGCSIVQWTSERRMTLAAQTLLYSDHTVSAIADEFGFADALYFSRKFKAAFGLSPRDYRKKHLIMV